MTELNEGQILKDVNKWISYWLKKDWAMGAFNVWRWTMVKSYS
jgi:hypothetical protein